jgi:copper chaperone
MQRFHVSGMSCGGCIKAVTRAIQSVAPGASVEVDLATKEVLVGERAADPGRIAAAIEGAGFTVEGRSP